MIQEPARVQETTYDSYTTSGTGENCSHNLNCSQKRTEQMSSRTTTIPIVINTQPNPRIILIKVPTQTSSSSSSSSKNNNRSKTANRTEQSPPRTRLIRIPFLPGSVSTASSTICTSPSTNTINLAASATASRIARPISPIPLTGTIYPQESSPISQENQVANDQTIGLPTVPSASVLKTVPVSSSTPQTLASMAGIQLTGADMLSHRDMSGAMPTATVEEIDVPVFIDEYLQTIEETSSTSSSNNHEESGKTIFSETDTFDFEFDINLIAEDPIDRKEMDQCNLDQDYSILSDNINSDSAEMDTFNSELLMNEGIEDDVCDMSSMLNSFDLTQCLSDAVDLSNILTNGENPMLCNFPEFSLYPFSQTKYINERPLLPDDNSMDNVYSIGCSQQSLGFGIGQLVDANEDAFTGVVVSEALSNFGAKRTATTASLISIAEPIPQKRSKLLLNINKTLDENFYVMNTPEVLDVAIDIENSNPPRNISTHDESYGENRSIEDNTNTETYTFTEEPTIREEFTFTEDNSTTTSILQDFSAPSTPNSSYSYAPTCQTGFAGFITAPASPAVSTTSTVTEGSNKRKRGRPAKERSEDPDPVVMSRMTEEEAKVYRDRIRNNEASRLSRKKNKMREAEEIREEEALQQENDRLQKDLKKLKDLVMRYKGTLKANFHRRSTYIKPKSEP